MKKLLVLFTLSVFTTNIFAQISISHAAKKIENQSIMVSYDSTKNFLGNKNVRSYIGQELYVNGKSASLQEYGYDNFKECKEPEFLTGRWGNSAPLNPNQTKYEDLFGKYFIVRDVQPDSRQKSDQYLYGNKWWFLLQNKHNSNEQIWFEYNGLHEHSFPFITISYFNFLRDNMIGEKFISAYSVYGKKIKTGIKDHDFFTGLEILQTPEDIWECIDITVEDENYDLILVLKNQNGETSTIKSNLLNRNGSLFIIKLPEFAALVEKYGKAQMELVRQRKSDFYMPAELKKMIYGESVY